MVVPPLNTQHKIVGILEKTEKLKSNRQKADELTDSYLKSVFFEMFGDPVKNDKNLELKCLNEIANINMGQSPPGDSYNEIGKGVPFFRENLNFKKNILK